MRNTQRKASSVRWIAALGAAALLTAGPVAAGQAHVDKASGKLRQPTPAEAKALADSVRALFARSMAAPQVTEHADGSLSANLGPDSLNVWVVTLNEDGSLNQQCVEGSNAANALQAAPALEEK